MQFPAIDPVALELGPVQIHWYGISYLAAFLTVWGLLRWRSRDDWSAQQVSDIVFYGALGAVLGGRIGYVLFYNLPQFIDAPLAIFKVWQGGMSFHGGLLGVLLALGLYARQQQRGFFELTDFISPAVPAGLFFGRIANFVNGELWGGPSQLPWAVVFPDPRAGGIPRHPSQLYEALLEGVVLFLLLWVLSAKPRPRYLLSGVFLSGYGLFRFLIEFVRVPDAHIGYMAFGWLTRGQLLCVPMLIFGICLISVAWRSSRPAKSVADPAQSS